MTSQLSPAKPWEGSQSELEKHGLRVPQTRVYCQLRS